MSFKLDRYVKVVPLCSAIKESEQLGSNLGAAAALSGIVR